MGSRSQRAARACRAMLGCVQRFGVRAGAVNVARQRTKCCLKLGGLAVVADLHILVHGSRSTSTGVWTPERRSGGTGAAAAVSLLRCHSGLSLRISRTQAIHSGGAILFLSVCAPAPPARL